MVITLRDIPMCQGSVYEKRLSVAVSKTASHRKPLKNAIGPKTELRTEGYLLNLGLVEYL